MSEPDAPQENSAKTPSTPPQQDPIFKARRGRNIAIALGLITFAILVFLGTVVRLGANVLDRPL
jgi:hypothetical protein